MGGNPLPQSLVSPTAASPNGEGDLRGGAEELFFSSRTFASFCVARRSALPPALPEIAADDGLALPVRE